MVKKKKDIREVRRSNKSQILWHLYNHGPLSRLELAKLCHLTTPSITQLMHDLLLQDEVVEIGSIQRNATGRKEILVDLNPNKNIALGVNIETDYTYFSVANVKEVFKIEKLVTADLKLNENLDALDEKIAELISEFPSINQICVASVGKVEDGVIVISYGEMPVNLDMQAHLTEKFGLKILVMSSVKAQALSLYRAGNENYLYVSHSPELSSAMIIKGEVIRGNDKVTGDLGHIIINMNGRQCKCGKPGCLNTYVSDEAIEERYFEKTGNKLTVNEIYALYKKDEAATELLNTVIKYLAVIIADVNELLNPEKVYVAGGIFSCDDVYEHGWEVLRECNFGITAERITDTENLKATAPAKYMICKSILEV